MVVMDANWLTVFVITFSSLFVVLYWFYVLPFESAKKAALATVFVGSAAFTAVLFNIVNRLGYLGGLLIVFMWIWPAVLVLLNRDHLRNLDQKKLVGLQIFRLIGGLFIFEMARGHIPASFALPAGVGDIIVGLVAGFFVLFFREIPRYGVIAVIVLGLVDFMSAFFFGYTSSPGPFQLFGQGFDNQTNLFPTGMIPLFLVPYAIAFHALSYINLRKV